jgi:ectoine hydroxylase-related dioxygenase (phytanoyl-CoA dioxygenase family)
MTQTEDRRDLSFKPVNNPSPKLLSPEQIAHYNEQGYVMPLDIYSRAEAAANRAYFDELLAQINEANDGRDSYAINSYQARCVGIYDLCIEPRILDLVAELIGPNIICWATHFFCKLPHDPKAVPWHQDASYWPLTPARTVTAWLAIDDADEGNSAMKFIPGTHKMGPLKWKDTEGPAVLNQEIVDIEKFGEPVHDVLKAGQISLHADMLAHGSDPNPSDRRRCGLTIRYCPPEVEALNPGWAENAIICRGEDPTGRWKHNPRPRGDDMTGPKPKSVGGN